MLDRMRNEFPPETNWSLSSLADLREFLPPLSHQPLTRELNSLIFELNTAGNLIANFPKPIAPNVDNSSNRDSVSVPAPPITPILPVMQANRSMRSRKMVRSLLNEDEPEPELPAIQVKRSGRIKRTPEAVPEGEKASFPVKVRLFLVLAFPS
jgi:hypothetical protein